MYNWALDHIYQDIEHELPCRGQSVTEHSNILYRDISHVVQGCVPCATGAVCMFYREVGTFYQALNYILLAH